MLHSSCSYLSLLLIEATVILCLISTVSCFPHDDLVLLPHDPVVEDGHWLTLNCTILPHYTGNYTSHDLYFVHNKVNFTNFTTEGSKTALLKLQWTLSVDGKGGGHVKCLLPDRTIVFPAVQSVTVVRRPLQPNVTGCFLWNLDHVNCSWQPSASLQQQHMHTNTPLNQTVQWKLRDEVNEVWHDAPCKDEVTDSCLWNISDIVHRFVTSERCCVHVFARVHFHNDLNFEVQSPQFCFRPEHNVVLDKPRSLTADNQTEHQIYIQWQAPLLDLKHVSSAGTELVYAVIVMSQWSETPIRNQSVAIQSLSFTSIPYTTYAVTVKVKTVESKYWSSPTTIKFTTPSAIPKMSPPSTANAFTVSHVEEYTRTVIIYWKALSVEDYYGPSLSYIVLTRNPPALVWNELSVVKSTDSPCPCSEVVIDKDADVELSVIARNEVGDTSSDVVLHLPAVQSSVMTNSLFTEFVVELTNDSTVMFSWQVKSPELSGNLTLFWCRSLFPDGRCADSIQWLDIAASKSEYNLTVDARDTNHYHYGAALKADSIHTENSGIEWVRCLYNVHGLAAPVQDLKAVVPKYGDPGQLLVTWVQPPCDKDYQHGYIRSLVLYYCRHTGSTCVDEPIEVSMPGYLTATNLTRLEPGEEYGIWMYSRTRAGLSLTHTDVIVAVASAAMLTPAIIAVITVSAAVFLVLAVAAFWMLCKYCRRCHDKLWPPVTVSVPPANVLSNTDTAMSAPMLAYSRISYTRQGSRLSSSSRDSGQFGIASASPLMSPESPPDSVVFPLMASNNHVENAPPFAHGVTYVNDKIVFSRRPTENHQPPSPTTGKVEWFPLQPMQSRHPHDTFCTEFPSPDADAAADVHEDEIALDNVASSQQNGACDTVVNPNSDYIPHEWLKI